MVLDRYLISFLLNLTPIYPHLEVKKNHIPGMSTENGSIYFAWAGGLTTAGFAAGTYNPVYFFSISTLSYIYIIIRTIGENKNKNKNRAFFCTYLSEKYFFPDCKRNEPLGFHPRFFISCVPLKEELLFQYFSRHPIHYYLHKFS